MPAPRTSGTGTGPPVRRGWQPGRTKFAVERWPAPTGRRNAPPPPGPAGWAAPPRRLPPPAGPGPGPTGRPARAEERPLPPSRRRGAGQSSCRRRRVPARRIPPAPSRPGDPAPAAGSPPAPGRKPPGAEWGPRLARPPVPAASPAPATGPLLRREDIGAPGPGTGPATPAPTTRNRPSPLLPGAGSGRRPTPQ